MAFGQSTDNAAIQIDKKIRVTGSEKSDFIFTRSLLVGQVDGVPFDVTRSGAYSLGFGYGFPIGKVFEFKLEPRVLWYKLFFAPSPQKWYPSSDSSNLLIFEKQRITYLELPIGIKFKLARNVVDRYKLLFEGGFSMGVQVFSSSKNRSYASANSNIDGARPKVTTKTNHIIDLADTRFGPYARIGTNWISLYGFYRMTEVFKNGRTYANPDGLTSRKYPIFPRLEVGISLTI